MHNACAKENAIKVLEPPRGPEKMNIERQKVTFYLHEDNAPRSNKSFLNSGKGTVQVIRLLCARNHKKSIYIF